MPPGTIRRWKRWLRIIYGEIVNLAHQRRLFREIAEMFRTNPALQQGEGTVWQWLAENYSTTAAVAVRRQADRSRRRPVASLENLLTEIAENPGVLTRRWFVSQYVRGQARYGTRGLTGERRARLRKVRTGQGQTDLLEDNPVGPQEVAQGSGECRPLREQADRASGPQGL